MQQLRLFLGLINYHGKFADTFTPFEHSFTINKKWSWSTESSKTFWNEESANFSLCSNITHYNPYLPIILVVDASMEWES